MKDNEYQCSMCHRVFEKGWTEEEARTEQKENGWENDECNLVCDDCYKEMRLDD